MKTKCNMPGDKHSTNGQKPILSSVSNRNQDNSANDFIANPTVAGGKSDFLDKAGYGEYRQQLAESDQIGQANGNLPLAEQIHHKLYERLRDADGNNLDENKPGDIATQYMPRAENMNVQSSVASSIAHRIIRNDPYLSIDGNRVWLRKDAPDLPVDIKAMRLPKDHPQNSTFSTTNKHIVDNQGMTLPGLVHNKIDNTWATQASRMMSKEPYQTVFTPAIAKSYMKQQNKIQQSADAWSDALHDAELVPKKQLDEGVAETQEKTREESLDRVEEVFNTIEKGKAFFFQIFHDWRARYYFKTRFFNPQGTSFEKASVALVWDLQPEFNTPGLHREYAIHMANLAGKDKGQYANYPERVEWFNTNIHTFQDILKHYDEADWPEAMTHFEMANSGQAGNIPIARDSTTSGYQVIASLMGDQDGLGSLTNINGEPTKNDLYTVAATKAINKLGLKSDPGKLRKVFKKPTMMVIYDATKKTIIGDVAKNYIEFKAKEQFPDGPPSPAQLTKWAEESGIKAEGLKLGNTFMDIMETDPAFKTAMDFKKLLKEAYLAGPTAESTWTFPDGQPVTFNPIEKSAYKDLKESGDKSNLYESTQDSKIGDDTYRYKARTFKKIDKPTDEAPRALMANFVQSVDAYLANYVTANMIQKGYPILVVHDSYATTAIAVERMQKLYLKGLDTLTTRDSNGQTFLEKAIQDLSGGKKTFKAKDLDRYKLAASQYALS